MHSKSVDSLSLTRAGFIEYFLVATKLVHALTAIAPALFLLYYPGLVPVELRSNMLGLLLFFGALTVIMFQALDVYSDDIFSNRLRFRIMFFAWASAFCLLLFMYQGLGLFPYLSSKLVIFWFTGSLLLFGVQRLLVLRLYRAWMKRGMYLQRTVILGFTESGMHLAEYLVRNHDIRSGIIGFIDDRSERVPENYNSLPLLGNTKDLEKLIRQEQVDQVLVALPWFAEGRIGAIVHRLRQLPVNVLLVPDMAAFRHAHNRIVDVSGIPMFNASELPLRGWSPLIKRCEDLVLASIALVLFAPLMALVALAIRLDSKGPVLFRQKRYGYNNRLIWVFKFRSMYTERTDANAERQTTRDDDRITRVGRFIRKTSIDELPQLFNVLAGSMSMVGPRPHATATKAAGIPFEEAVSEYSSRHRVKQCRQRELAAGAFAEAPDISVDYALMERSDKVAVVPCSIGWSDIGSWQALRELSAADENGNQVRGESVLHDVSNCYIDSPKRLVGAVGVHDLIIVDTPDALLVADAARSQDVKFVAQELKRRGHDAFRLHRTVSRPWGTYTVLEEGRRFKIKRIVVRPKASLSLQMHHHRSEHWIVVSGMALVENGEREFLLNTNESTFIPAGHSHRLSNPGIIDLVMIEVQSGEYLGEDDIVRFNDIYGRAPASDEKKA
ncbi:TPA: exopolysaccharide biosynthesis polyprenyl glycosylphosphotransferase [Pseudomonas aeruginosa]